MGPEILIPISFFFCVGFVVKNVLGYRERKLELESRLRGNSAIDNPRMERMEQAIDAMALEIERISESQRFMTRLLSERAAGGGALPPSQNH